MHICLSHLELLLHKCVSVANLCSAYNVVAPACFRLVSFKGERNCYSPLKALLRRTKRLSNQTVNNKPGFLVITVMENISFYILHK